MNHPKAYYNEIDPFSCAWLQKLMDRGLIMPGTIDNRSIEDVNPEDLAGYTRVGFFAGIGGWDLALQLAGWPEDKPIWHGSCPCQPFSSAGKGGGFADERHLWPAFHHLIRVCRPAIVVGEQVASPDGLRWCDLVQDDLEVEGYAFGKADLCAAGVGAPHIRQRLYWVGRLGIPHSPGWQQGQPPSPPMGHGSPIEPAGGALGLAHPQLPTQPRQRPVGGEAVCLKDAAGSAGGGVGYRVGGEPGDARVLQEQGPAPTLLWPSPLHGFWRDADWLFCRDGKWRPVEPGSFPLVDGFPESLASVLSRQRVVWSEIAAYAESRKTNPDEIMRLVREGIQQGTGWEEPSTGVRVEFHAPEVLLDLLLGAEAARNRTADGCCGKKEGQQIVDRAMRVMRINSGAVCASLGWESEKQHPHQSPETVSSLPFILARHTEAYRDEVLKAHAALNRAGLLRGLGNAIVPQVAAEFLKAALNIP